MDSDSDDKQRLIARNHELQLKIDDLESLLDYEQHERKKLSNKLDEQKGMIEEIRRLRDDCVDYKDYQELSQNLENMRTKYLAAKKTIDSLSAQLDSETNENAVLADRVKASDNELVKLKTSLEDYRKKYAALSQEITSVHQLGQNVNELKSDLEKERAENAKLMDEMLHLCREEMRNNESNISVEDLNTSFNKFMNALNTTSAGESLDCVVDIKLAEVQSALSDKVQEVCDLNQEIARLNNDSQSKQQIIDDLKEKLSQESHKLIEANNKLSESLAKSDAFKTSLDEEQKKLQKTEEDFKELQSNFNHKVSEKTAELESQLNQKAKEVAKVNQTLTELQNQISEERKVRDSLELNLIEERKRVQKSHEELREIHSVVDKRFKSLKDSMTALRACLAEEERKRKEAESQLKNLKTRLNTEEMSFEMERKHKERYAAENREYALKIKVLEDQNQRLQESLNASRNDTNKSANVFMPTTINISAQPNHNNNFSLSSIDINQNASNISLNVSRRLPSGTGSRLAMADEEGEFMDPNHVIEFGCMNLEALKRGECNVEPIDPERLSILQRRNTMVKPHLKCSYGVELPFIKECVTPETVKQGFLLHEPKTTLRQLQNTTFQETGSYRLTDRSSDRRPGSVSLNNISIKANKSKRFE